MAVGLKPKCFAKINEKLLSTPPDSATTVMVVSFVNAGLMSLLQAVGVIMGANIGTTIIAQMVSFKLDSIAPIFIGVGAILMLIAKKKKISQYKFYR